MNKVTLLYHPAEHSNFTATHLEPIWRRYFNIEPVDESKVYNTRDCIIITKHLNADKWYQPWVEQGHKLIVDHLWDNHVECCVERVGNQLTLKAPTWSWVNESLWYKSLKYDELEFSRSPTKFFLTLMARERPHRARLYNNITRFLADSLVSYSARNIQIPGDINSNEIAWQRYVNTEWYNSTCFSLVAETKTSLPTFLSEKTFKPMAFRQPFIVFGSSGTIKYLHENGFETFGHLIDESYDMVADETLRLEKIIEQVEILYKQFTNGESLFCDSITEQILEHNFNHFYDQSLVTSIFTKEAIEPLLEFAESQ